MAALQNKQTSKTIDGGKVNYLAPGSTNGVPYGQTPGFGKGTPEISQNQLPSTARVIKSAPSTLMTGMSDHRGSGGAK